MKKLKNIENKVIPSVFFIILITIWQYIVEFGYIEKYILPSPTDILTALIKILPGLQHHLYATLQEALLGFGIAVIFAIVTALLMDSVELLKKAFYPLILVSQTVPIIALAPLFVIWFGFGMLPKIIVVVLVCYFPIVVSLLEGLSAVDKDLLNLLRSMGAKKLQIYKLVKFPGSIVNFFSGLRIAATYSIMGAVIGEWLGGEKGLGVYMIRVKHSYALDKVFAVILIIVLLSLILFKAIDILQHMLTPWSKQQEEHL